MTDGGPADNMWGAGESARLFLCHTAVSQDQLQATNRKGTKLWEQISSLYNSSDGPDVTCYDLTLPMKSDGTPQKYRAASACKSKWHVLRERLRIFKRAYEAVKGEYHSGYSESDFHGLAKKKYLQLRIQKESNADPKNAEKVEKNYCWNDEMQALWDIPDIRNAISLKLGGEEPEQNSPHPPDQKPVGVKTEKRLVKLDSICEAVLQDSTRQEEMFKLKEEEIKLKKEHLSLKRTQVDRQYRLEQLSRDRAWYLDLIRTQHSLPVPDPHLEQQLVMLRKRLEDKTDE